MDQNTPPHTGSGRPPLPWEIEGEAISPSSPSGLTVPAPEPTSPPPPPPPGTAFTADSGYQAAAPPPASEEEPEPPRPVPTFAIGAASEDRTSLIDKIRRAVIKTATPDEDADWMGNQRPPGYYDAWIDELGTPPPPGTEPEFDRVPTPLPPRLLEADPKEGDEPDPSLFAADGSVLREPRRGALRYVAYAAASVVGIALLALYVWGYPSYRAAQYRQDLSAAFDSTTQLREEMGPRLTGGLPRDLAGEASALREIAAPYPDFTRRVNALPPDPGALTYRGPMRPVLRARESLQELDDSMRPGVEQLRIRASYYDTLSAIRDQMALASAGADSIFEGSDVSTLVEGTVANATSFEATLASQRPPAGFETLNAVLLDYLRDYSKTGRAYSLAVRTEDPNAAAIRLQLLETARSFPKVLGEPVGPGITDTDLSRIESSAAAAAERLGRYDPRTKSLSSS